MSYIEIIEVPQYYPLGVSEIIGYGSKCFVGAIDESMVLKYLYIPGDCENI